MNTDREQELLLKVESLQNLLIAQATGKSADENEYKELRDVLTKEIIIKPLLPRFVISCRDLNQFWEHIKGKYAHYQERREYLWSEFAPLIQKLEGLDSSPVDHSVQQTLPKLDVEHVRQIWGLALVRKDTDPDGAITAARTLVESVCKSILDDFGISYDQDMDLPKLYRLTSEHLNLAPSQHTEKIFKQILGGCQSVVEGLGALRNKLGDAHGQGKLPVKPAPRHAELAVNLAGTMATYLVNTWEHIRSKNEP